MSMVMHGLPSPIHKCANRIRRKAAVGNKMEEEKKKIGRPPGVRMALRRPVGTLFGASYDEKKWAALPIPLKRRLTHAGRIEETDSGMPRVLPCWRCARKRRICRVYTPDAQQEYGGSSQAKGTCGSCRFDSQECEDY